MKPRPKGYPYHTLIETYRSWGNDPGLVACLSGRRLGGFGRFVRLVLRIRKLDVCERAGHFEEGLRLGREALQEARDASLVAGQAEAFLVLSVMHSGVSELERTREVAEQAQELFVSIGNPLGQAKALNLLGYANDHLGERETAMACYAQALRIAEAAGTKSLAATCLNNLSTLHVVDGDLAKALQQMEKALRLAEEVEDAVGQGYCLSGIGFIHGRLGNSALALSYQERAATCFGVAGDRSGQAGALRNIGLFQARLGNYPEALMSYQQAYQLYMAIGFLGGGARVLNSLGEAHLVLGDFDSAIAELERALAVRREIGERRSQVITLASMAEAHLGMADFRKARQGLHEAQDIVQGMDPDNELLCGLALSAAALCLEAGDTEPAAREIESGLLLAEALTSKRHRALLLSLRARLKEKQGDWPGSERDFTESVNLFGSLGEKAELAKVSYYYGKALLAHGVEDKGRWYLAEARRLWEAIGAKGWLARMESEGP